MKENKINFWNLFKKFRGKTIRNYLITISTILVWWPILLTIGNVVNSPNLDKILKENNNNYAILLPKFLQKFITKLTSEE